MKEAIDTLFQRIRYQRDDRVHAGLAPVSHSPLLMQFRTRTRNMLMALEDGWHEHVNEKKRPPWE
jgi:hypothetical protein